MWGHPRLDLSCQLNLNAQNTKFGSLRPTLTKRSSDNPRVHSMFSAPTRPIHAQIINPGHTHGGDFLGPTPILMTIHPAGRMLKTKKYGGGESLGPLSDERQPAASPCLGLGNYIPTKHYPPRAEHSSITEEWRRPLDAVRLFCKSSITYDALGCNRRMLYGLSII